MSRLALGLIETVGLAAAIEAADTAVKSANVKLIGYELTKGGGLVTIKLEGDVGAVNAAVQAASMAASKVSSVYSRLVIPRPHDELSAIVVSKETIGIEKHCIMVEEIKAEEMKIDNIKVDDIKIEDDKTIKASCNLCNDPQCTRKKGEPRNICIHYNEKKSLEGGQIDG